MELDIIWELHEWDLKEDSVCDLNLKYHGIDNLYINSTSVFPTGGIANPTLTLLALTARLAENLNND